jgi:hypothetical protein
MRPERELPLTDYSMGFLNDNLSSLQLLITLMLLESAELMATVRTTD